MFSDKKIVIKGAGDLATGVAARLWRSGFSVMMTEIEQPLTVRRSVSLSDAVYEGKITVEDMIARRAKGRVDILKTFHNGEIPVVVDPKAEIVKEIGAFAVVDAIMAKKNIGTRMDDAMLVVGLGPGFVAGVDVHAIVETKRGHTLGRVIRTGSAIPNTGIPGEVKGFGSERVIRAPGPGIIKGVLSIGTHVEKGDVVAHVGDYPFMRPFQGCCGDCSMTAYG